MIFDTHCHLNHEDLYQDIDSVIKNAKDVGVDKFMVVGWDKKSSFKAVELAEKYEGVYAAIGFFPLDTYTLTEQEYQETISLAKYPKVLAIGEIGLDYYWEKDPIKKEIQKEFFIKQLKLANEIKKPVIIHNREAFGDCLPILKKYKPFCGGVMHCYGGSVESLKDVFDVGLMIGLDGPVTFKNARVPKDVAANVPLDKLVVETDCPYLTPHPYRGSRNEPKYIHLVIDEIAKIKNINKQELEVILYKNSCKLFNL